jgi:hypothetical protein
METNNFNCEYCNIKYREICSICNKYVCDDHMIEYDGQTGYTLCESCYNKFYKECSQCTNEINTYNKIKKNISCSNCHKYLCCCCNEKICFKCEKILCKKCFKISFKTGENEINICKFCCNEQFKNFD